LGEPGNPTGVGRTLGYVLASEHATLLRTATDVVADLYGFQGRLRRHRVSHYQHDVFAERARSLAIYLSSALRLASADEYISAYAVLRAALEHHLTDRLLFVANRYKQQYNDMKKADYQRLVRQRAQGQPGTETIVRIIYDGRTMWVVRSGLHVRDEAGKPRRQTLSIYYFLLQEFDPFVGHYREQEHLSRGFTPVEQRIRDAQEQQRTYRPLRWSQIKANLGENKICSQETLRRFDVHYRFLSAFVHPVPAGYDLVYGRNRPTGAPRYDHYASELALVYINKLGAAELKFLERTAWDSNAARARGRVPPPCLWIGARRTPPAPLTTTKQAPRHHSMPLSMRGVWCVVSECQPLESQVCGRLAPTDRPRQPSIALPQLLFRPRHLPLPLQVGLLLTAALSASR
jgi:hypothetical protein